jgi:glutathione S-transferase/3-isopropylmalate dehydratase
MTESIAMMLYIMGKYGPTELAVRPDEPAYPDFLQYLIYAEATAAAPVNALIAGKFMAKDGEDKNWTSDFILASLAKRAAMIDARVQDRDYMVGDRFTAADIATAYTLGVYAFVGLDEKLGEAAKAYQARMCARPAFQRAAAVQ